jgi:hypothetical protein
MKKLYNVTLNDKPINKDNTRRLFNADAVDVIKFVEGSLKNNWASIKIERVK